MQEIIHSPPHSIHFTSSQYTSNIYIIAKKDINQPKLKHMITIPVMYFIDGQGSQTVDYKSMEDEFRKEMNLLLDEEIRQDNDLNPKDPNIHTFKVGTTYGF